MVSYCYCILCNDGSFVCLSITYLVISLLGGRGIGGDSSTEEGTSAPSPPSLSNPGTLLRIESRRKQSFLTVTLGTQ